VQNLHFDRDGLPIDDASHVRCAAAKTPHDTYAGVHGIRHAKPARLKGSQRESTPFVPFAQAEGQ
jgi:hypothetical protein